jgi:hypothetical protein
MKEKLLLLVRNVLNPANKNKDFNVYYDHELYDRSGYIIEFNNEPYLRFSHQISFGKLTCDLTDEETDELIELFERKINNKDYDKLEQRLEEFKL